MIAEDCPSRQIFTFHRYASCNSLSLFVTPKSRSDAYNEAMPSINAPPQAKLSHELIAAAASYYSTFIT
ncbi:hypothetical protein M378DRAFT_168019 [Amanita muscaria Koide BX008]|uniref:Uncharacterized protein n=1 Tax=Amanita muscaria (strain Koide BX008) TaxID=946122 RepID=A0A0C2W1I9_AMAMK|nr:hypothetical protein M378DRAFT_173926 [Amanita muscaria Koide BX008]KIL60528.1 hypothetical protein M378DRAFT_168019 [Amanita muscaria Koide BX008]